MALGCGGVSFVLSLEVVLTAAEKIPRPKGLGV